MNDLQELRVKVAELCGWKKDARNWWFPPRDNGLQYTNPPNYPSDLNACAIFPEILRNRDSSGALLIQYYNALDRMCGPKVIDATAEQRCRAFVATMEGKNERSN